MVIAMCLDAVVHERFGTISRLVFSLPILRALARRSAWIRRFFGLEPDSAANGDLHVKDVADPRRGAREQW